MTTERSHGRSTTTITADKASEDQRLDIPSSVLSITNAIREISQSSTAILQEFQGVVKAILPVLNAEEQNQVYEAFIGFHKMLMASQKFLTRSLILTARARTTTELVASIDIKTIEKLTTTVMELLEKFYKLHPILDGKMKDQRAIKLWRDIFSLLTAIGIAACSIGLGVGYFSSGGFTKYLKVFLVATGSITVASASATAAAHVAQHVSALDRMILILKDVAKQLSQLSQNYSKIEAMSQVLSDDDDTKERLMRLLRETEVEVNKGFAILKQL